MNPILIHNTPQDWDRNDTKFKIGQEIRILGCTAKITRINGKAIWITYTSGEWEGEDACVHELDLI